MKRVYASKVKAGDRIVVTDGKMNTVRRVTHKDNNVIIALNNNRLLVLAPNTHVMVFESSFSQGAMTVSDMYESILDDKISLSEFSEWCSVNGVDV